MQPSALWRKVRDGDVIKRTPCLLIGQPRVCWAVLHFSGINLPRFTSNKNSSHIIVPCGQDLQLHAQEWNSLGAEGTFRFLGSLQAVFGKRSLFAIKLSRITQMFFIWSKAGSLQPWKLAYTFGWQGIEMLASGFVFFCRELAQRKIQPCFLDISWHLQFRAGDSKSKDFCDPPPSDLMASDMYLGLGITEASMWSLAKLRGLVILWHIIF